MLVGTAASALVIGALLLWAQAVKPREREMIYSDLSDAGWGVLRHSIDHGVRVNVTNTQAGRVAFAQWSSDGERLAVLTYTDAGYILSIFDERHQLQDRVELIHIEASALAWSPYGATIAVHGIRIERDYTVCSIQLIDVEARAVTERACQTPYAARWTPTNDLITIEYPPAEPIRLTYQESMLRSNPSGIFASHSEYLSPDSRFFAQSIYTDNPPTKTIEIRRAADETLIASLAPRDFNLHPSWSPDGQRLAFVNVNTLSPYPYYLYVVDSDGKNLQLLAHFEVSLYDHVPYFPQWTDDGALILMVISDQTLLIDAQRGGIVRTFSAIGNPQLRPQVNR